MSWYKKHRLQAITVTYWVLLLYIIAALIWWYVALEKQNKQITDIALAEIKKDDFLFEQKQAAVLQRKTRKQAQYLGEGVIFLALILAGAIYIYRATRRQIKQSQEQQNFLIGVTHELKTPIAVAQLNLETLQKRELSAVQQQKLVANALDETKRLNDLATNLLLVSRLEAGYRPEKQLLDLSDLVVNLLLPFQNRFQSKKIEVDIESGIQLIADEFLLSILINNLIDNAIKYTAEEGTVFCSCKQAEGKVILTVGDNGPGIPDAEKSKIFGKYYRVSNQSSAKGSGMGLYLVQKVAKLHQGIIKLYDNKLQGAIFEISFSQHANQ